MATNAAARVVDLEEMEGSIGELAERVARTSQPIVLRRGGMPLAVIAPFEPIDADMDDDEARHRDEALLGEVSALFSDVPLDDLECEINKAVDAVRARRRAETASSH